VRLGVGLAHYFGINHLENEARAARLEARVTRLEARVTRLEARVTRLEARVTRPVLLSSSSMCSTCLYFSFTLFHCLRFTVDLVSDPTSLQERNLKMD
jgi:hypothetical protein